ncbi:MAG: RNA polymerase sigma factor [Clostridiales bacterium]|nr:RNA polymerase sigma factor [uncultured Blautia sp.]MBS6195188.1 RNA polymerase sigma factor [Clostridiales bacterium]
MDYEKLYHSYYLQVYSYVMTIIKDQALAEEITQNTFFKAMTSKKQFEGRSSELSWLCGIAKHLAMDEHRKNARLSELDETVAAPSVDLEKETEDKDTALQIHLILHELQEPYKEVFQLRVFGELSFSQIGMIFGKTENWARVTYHRARIKIQERMGKNE